MLNLLTCAYVALLILRPQEFVPGLQGTPLQQLLLVGCIAGYVFSGRSRSTLPQFPLILWFLLAASVSLGLAGWWGGVWPMLDRMAPVVVLFAILTVTTQELADLRRILGVMVACACVLVLHGHWQLEQGMSWAKTPLLTGRITYVGIFNDPNDLGQLFAMCVAACFYLLYGAGTLMRVVYVIAMAWLSYGVYMTDSRGTMLAVFAIFGVVLMRRYGRIIAVAAGLLAAIVLMATTRMATLNTQEASAYGRVEAWYEGFQMFKSNPMFGVGAGLFTDYNWLTAHNFIILPMAELGMFGFVPWFGLLWFSGMMLLRLHRETLLPATTAWPDENARAHEKEAIFGISLIALSFVVSSFFLSQSYKHVLFISAGLIIARLINAGSRKAELLDISLVREMPRLVLASVGAIAIMWILTRVLL